MALRCYTPPIARLQHEYREEISRRIRRAMRGPAKPGGPKIPDNSEPWLANPQTVDDLWYIACCVDQCVKEFQAWRQPPSSSS